jgi:hypothetical protein
MMSERRFFGKCQRLATGAKGVSVACGEWSPFFQKILLEIAMGWKYRDRWTASTLK